jgi:hypothetical protein
LIAPVRHCPVEATFSPSFGENDDAEVRHER